MAKQGLTSIVAKARGIEVQRAGREPSVQVIARGPGTHVAAPAHGPGAGRGAGFLGEQRAGRGGVCFPETMAGPIPESTGRRRPSETQTRDWGFCSSSA